MVKARKAATYAMASAMIACAGISTGNMGVQAATKAPAQSSQVTKTNADYEQMYKDYISNFIPAPMITSVSSKKTPGYIFDTYYYDVYFSEMKGAQSYEVMISSDKDFKTEVPGAKYTSTTTATKAHFSSFLPLAYVKVRANFGNGIYSKWSAVKAL